MSWNTVVGLQSRFIILYSPLQTIYLDDRDTMDEIVGGIKFVNYKMISEAVIDIFMDPY